MHSWQQDWHSAAQAEEERLSKSYQKRTTKGLPHQSENDATPPFFIGETLNNVKRLEWLLAFILALSLIIR